MERSRYQTFADLDLNIQMKFVFSLEVSSVISALGKAVTFFQKIKALPNLNLFRVPVRKHLGHSERI